MIQWLFHVVLLVGAFMAGYWWSSEVPLPIPAKECPRVMCPQLPNQSDYDGVIQRYQAEIFQCVEGALFLRKSLDASEAELQATRMDLIRCKFGDQAD